MHVLAIRFSAFGDVAMTIPVIWSAAKQYPQHQFTVLSRESMRPLFLQMPENVTFRGVNLKQTKYKGIGGMWRLAGELIEENRFDAVADLHDVLRSQMLRLFFQLRGITCCHINKGKTAKRRLTRSHHKIMQQLPTSFDRYRVVFSLLGLPIQMDFTSIYAAGQKGDFSCIASTVPARQPDERWIGIAPFAAHQGKIYPLEMMEQVVIGLGHHKSIRIFLFGAGEEEEKVLSDWATRYPWTTRPKDLRMEKELILMSHLDLMVSMDSANMHLASLVNTPVLSIWGATHPYCGFMGYGQPEGNALQINGLTCRPCSTFGNKPCLLGDYACLRNITPERVIQRVLSLLA